MNTDILISIDIKHNNERSKYMNNKVLVFRSLVLGALILAMITRMLCLAVSSFK